MKITVSAYSIGPDGKATLVETRVGENQSADSLCRETTESLGYAKVKTWGECTPEEKEAIRKAEEEAEELRDRADREAAEAEMEESDDDYFQRDWEAYIRSKIERRNNNDEDEEEEF